MPLYYSTARAEHTAVREGAGVFDVSHMGQLEVTGPGAREGLARILTNDLAISPGHGQYTLMLEDDGGVIDDLIVYELEDRFLLVVNASNIAPCRERLADRLPADATLVDRSPETAMLALQGPAWAEVLRPLCARGDAFALDYFAIGEDLVAGVPCLIARTGYTGEPGVELMCPWDDAPAVWDALMSGRPSRDAGGPRRPRHPAAGDGLPALRPGALARAHPDRGRAALGLRHRGRALLRRGHAAPAGGRGHRRAPGDLPPDRAGDPPGRARRWSSDGRPVGTVTSGTLSPTLDVGIGMAYVPSAVAGPDNDLVIDVRGKPKAARTARRPLVATSPKE